MTSTNGIRRAAALLLTVGLGAGLAGCESGGSGGSGGSDDGSGRAGAKPPSTVSTPAVTPSPHGPCYDGRCRITVESGTRIAIDRSFGLGGLKIVDVGPGGLALEATGTEGVYLGTAVSEGGTGSLNKLGFEVVSISGGKAVLDIHPARS
ncbi:hypothetical protein ACIQNU_20635 [Streptomyces sp. NPDC091292]|uniref:hypothetical protein n=1 Tax=Streptomyces sp. NPDC091292 TaxID=3365991 RepID=UPI00380D6D3B